MATDRYAVRPVFNAYVAYLRSTAYLLVPALGAAFFIIWGKKAGADDFQLFTSWQRVFPLYIVLITVFFIAPAFLLAWKKADYGRTVYRIAPGYAEGTIWQFGKSVRVEFTVDAETSVRVRRSPVQRLAGIGDVVLRKDDSFLRIHDIREYSSVSGMLGKKAEENFRPVD